MIKKTVKMIIGILFLASFFCLDAGCRAVPAPQTSPDASSSASLASPRVEAASSSAPEHSAAGGSPAPTATPSVSPTPSAGQEKYPLSPKSKRKDGEEFYPEEKHLNDDKEKFRAVVDITNQIVTVYERGENGEYDQEVRRMICSSGSAKNPTPLGTFRMGDDYKRFGFFAEYKCYAQYWSKLTGNIYFHSLLYSRRSDKYLIKSSFKQLGKRVSHGCIRLMPDDAHWVYLYLCPGTSVTVTDQIKKDKTLTASLKPAAYPTPEAE